MAAPVPATTFRCIRSRRSIDHPLYLDALVEKVDEALARFPESERAEIVFSAHSVPVAVIEKGDPYQQHIEETVELADAARRMAEPPPALLPEQGGRQQVAAAVAASDDPRPGGGTGAAKCASCPSPLFPITWRRWARSTTRRARKPRRSGSEQFEMTSGLNDSPTFIAALADLVETAIGMNLDRQRDTDRLVAAD